MADRDESQRDRENPLHLDVEALRAKYAAERDKRVRKAGTAQYNFAEGKYSDFGDDPFTPEVAPRDAETADLDVLVIGGGFGGLLTAASLRTAGIDNFRIIDVAADFGGTWYWNRYPGVRCDVESYVYLPLLEETGYMPTEKYTTGAEIFGYCRLLGRHFDLYPQARFQTKVTKMTWNEDDARWIVETDRGDRFAARFVTTQSGIFSRPQLPGIPGIEEFGGKVFHTSRWNYDYTGGEDDGRLTKLAGKRVAIVGTGSSGLQVIPSLATWAEHVTVFQRTPTAVGRRDNGPTDPEWFASLPAGWHQKRMESFDLVCSGLVPPEPCEIDDGWTRHALRMAKAAERLPENERTPERIAEVAEIVDFEWGEEIRHRVDELVPDPQKAKALKAYYKTGCKRPGFSDDYLPAVARDNVALIDTTEKPIERITEKGIVVDGVESPFDCLIFATGFELGTTWAHQAGYDVVGRDGTVLAQKWERGLRTFYGLFSKGFPNLFFMGLTQTGTTVSVTHMLAEQVKEVTYVIDQAKKQGLRTVEATGEAEQAWCEVIAEKAAARRPAQLECTPGYFNNEGKPDDTTSAISSGLYYPASEFFQMLDQWRTSGQLEGLSVSR